MRIEQIDIVNVPPVSRFFADQLSDVVVLAGPNGVGKTRLVEALLQLFQNPSAYLGAGTTPRVRVALSATNQTETSEWGKSTLDSNDSNDASLLLRTLQKARQRSNWQSSVLNFESDRTVQQINPFSFSWDSPDPWIENVVWNVGLTGLRSRLQDTVHSLFRKVKSRRELITKRIEELMKDSKLRSRPAPPNLFEQLEQDFPDPIAPFKQAFSQLLAPKILDEPNPREQQLYYLNGGNRFPVSSLSSGEREVVNIVFDFLLRSPTDCITIFDEPELHLHPELSYKLLQALKAVGRNNQFIFCTHSPEIITASLDNTVVFLTPPKGNGANQAVKVREDDETNEALKLLGQSIGIIALGRKLVLIEGKESSLDKQTYGAILRDQFPAFVLVPTGGRGLITSFASLQAEVLERTIWGVEFFMLCDRDSAAAKATDNPTGRLQFLPRYHLENYFLEESILTKVFQDMEPEDSWLRSETNVRAVLREIAAGLVSYSVALITSAYFRELVGNLSIMPKDCQRKTVSELVSLLTSRLETERLRIQSVMSQDDLAEYAKSSADKIQKSLDEDSEDWKRLIPGKQMLHIFAAKANLEVGRLKTKYLRCAASVEPNPFAEIVEIFRRFEGVTRIA